jgi:3-oxoacyl-[acyl-carrier protein] reductase
VNERIILITGASRGIGRAIALAFAEPSHRLWLNYHASEAAAAELADECKAKGAEVKLLRFDVGDGAQIQSVLSPLLEEATPSVVVNNAGITEDGLFAVAERDRWDRVNRVNLGGLYGVTHAVLQPMLRARKGRIINLTSISGERGNSGQVIYSTTKAGIIGFTKALALEVARRGITVNAVSPGFIETEMTKDVPRAEVEKSIPLQRFGRPDEVAAAVRFLASDEAGYITGHVLSVNGGLYT